ncbi:unnamed protein product [Vitrella brassicaformis CCMP3155]|uniref:J domain-containing protein n=1 Tax=Vitrella brassicaformis (strain CCMP3155) TaxID=1169540 RepID=A0A0G4EYC5_VITBC|nr:unnamed protein product [Vitrella brassicaformis CCMP3155]|eukprot:CEM04140.1 unnamed protein product [Vitrella brassicaformis CCMP3155]
MKVYRVTSGPHRVKANHPDKGGDEAAFQAISEAHEALTGLSGGGAASDGRQRDGPYPYGCRTFREWYEPPEAAATAQKCREEKEAELPKLRAMLAEVQREEKEGGGQESRCRGSVEPGHAAPHRASQRNGASAEDDGESPELPTNSLRRGAADRSRVTRPEGFKAPPVGPATGRLWAAAAAPPPFYQWRPPPPPPHPYIRMPDALRRRQRPGWWRRMKRRRTKTTVGVLYGGGPSAAVGEGSRGGGGGYCRVFSGGGLFS